MKTIKEINAELEFDSVQEKLKQVIDTANKQL